VDTKFRDSKFRTNITSLFHEIIILFHQNFARWLSQFQYKFATTKNKTKDTWENRSTLRTKPKNYNRYDGAWQK
jgi:hypothetical protein